MRQEIERYPEAWGPTSVVNMAKLQVSERPCLKNPKMEGTQRTETQSFPLTSTSVHDMRIPKYKREGGGREGGGEKKRVDNALP